jgi:gamma-glutamyl phosphate reductase
VLTNVSLINFMIGLCNLQFCRMPSSGVDGIFSISLHLTQSQKAPEFEKNVIESRVETLLGVAQYIHSGRPSLHSEIAALRQHERNGVVFTCGPQELVDECSVIAMHSGVDFKFESFLF